MSARPDPETEREPAPRPMYLRVTISSGPNEVVTFELPVNTPGLLEAVRAVGRYGNWVGSEFDTSPAPEDPRRVSGNTYEIPDPSVEVTVYDDAGLELERRRVGERLEATEGERLEVHQRLTLAGPSSPSGVLQGL